MSISEPRQRLYADAWCVMQDERLHPSVKQLDAVYFDGNRWLQSDESHPPMGVCAYVFGAIEKESDMGNLLEMRRGDIVISWIVPARSNSEAPMNKVSPLGHDTKDYQAYVKPWILYSWDYINKRTIETGLANPLKSHILGFGYNGRGLFRNGRYSYPGIILFPFGGRGNSQTTNIYNTINNFPSTGEVNKFYYDQSRNELYYWDGQKYQLFNKEVYMLPTKNGFPPTGQTDRIYIDDSKHKPYYWDGSRYRPMWDDTDHWFDQVSAPWTQIGQKCDYIFPFAGVYEPTRTEILCDGQTNSYTGLEGIDFVSTSYISHDGDTVTIPAVSCPTSAIVLSYLNNFIGGTWTYNPTTFTYSVHQSGNLPNTTTAVGTSPQGVVRIQTISCDNSIVTNTQSQIVSISGVKQDGSPYSFWPSPMFYTDTDAVAWLRNLNIGTFDLLPAGSIKSTQNPNTITGFTWKPQNTSGILTSNILQQSCTAIMSEVTKGTAVYKDCAGWHPSTNTNPPTGIWNGDGEVISHGLVDGLTLTPNTLYYINPTTGQLQTAKSKYIAGYSGCTGDLNVHIRYASEGSAENLANAIMGEGIPSVLPCVPWQNIWTSDNDHRVNPIYAEIVYYAKEEYPTPFTEWKLRDTTSSVDTFENLPNAQNSHCVIYDSSFIDSDKYFTAPTDGYYTIKATFEIRMTQSDWTINGLTHATMDGKIKINGLTRAFGKYQIYCARSTVDPFDITELFAPWEISATVIASMNAILSKWDTVDAVFAWDKKAYVNYILLSYIGLPHNL